MRFGVLGPVRVARDGRELDLGPHKQRALLTALLLTPNRPVPIDRVVELLWGDQPPPAVSASLHGYVAGLRRVMEPGREARARPDVLRTTPLGYELRVDEESLDAAEFAASATVVHRTLSGPARFGVPLDQPVEALVDAATRLDEALALWRGEAYAELGEVPAAEAERSRLTELRVQAVHDLARARLALDQPADAVRLLAPLAEEHPLREDLWARYVLALARAGRASDALAELRRVRERLADDLGIDPGAELSQLQVAVLRRDVGARPPVRTSSSVRPSPVVRGSPRPDPPPGQPPLVGRESELGALTVLLERVASGSLEVALLVGEPGIGKSRLAAEVAGLASARDFVVLTGRCAQDEGAPPLWPWRTVLRDLRAVDPQLPLPHGSEFDQLTAGTAGAEGYDRFRQFEVVTDLLTAAAARHPVVLIFEDVHWADPSTLRLLQHLVTYVPGGRLMVLLTRRAAPLPHPALADLLESLARRGAHRLDLGGLTAGHIVQLAEQSQGTALDEQTAQMLFDRTEGNPFFLVELLRSAGGGQVRVGSDGVPAVVSDVILARVGQLPDTVQRVLQVASVLGRTPDLRLLGELLERDQWALADDLDIAVAAGLMLAGSGPVSFRHALVRDAVYVAMPPLRRQQWHARAAARLAQGARRGQLAEIARHWRRAGVTHAADACRAAAQAAAYAADVQAYEEAAELLADALLSQADDPAATPMARYDLLLARAAACRRAADTVGQTAATAEAVSIADSLGDIRRLAEAAVAGTEGGLWSNRPSGTLDPVAIAVLRRAIAELPPDDDALRCRVYLALSRELFWAPRPQEHWAYAEQALTLARRIGDPTLISATCGAAFVALMRPDTLPQRTELALEALAAARTAGDAEAEVVALFWQALAAGEAGRLSERRTAVRTAMQLAERDRRRYLQVMLGTYEASWLVLEDRTDEARNLVTRCEQWAAQASFPFRDEALAGAHLALTVWGGDAEDLLPRLIAVAEVSPVDLTSTIALLLLRTDQVERVRDLVSRQPLPHSEGQFNTLADAAIAAEAGLLLGRPDLGSAAYRIMQPWPDRMATAGTGLALGPVEGFLALAAAAVGETALASDHADRAAAICLGRGLPAAGRWLAMRREQFGF